MSRELLQLVETIFDLIENILHIIKWNKYNKQNLLEKFQAVSESVNNAI